MAGDHVIGGSLTEGIAHEGAKLRDVDVLPFHTYLWKICSRCNLDCRYCYVYNGPDQSWRRQPALMTEATARHVARRMLEHLRDHGKKDASVVFHGGEPLLGGVDHLRMLVGVLVDTFAGTGIQMSVGIQSNLLCFDEEIGSFLKEAGLSIGVSLDGPPEINDRQRVDHSGRPSSRLLEEKLDLLVSTPFRGVFSGFLCVIDPTTDPTAVTEYLLRYDPIGIDFLFPLDNHDRLPAGKERDQSASPYGEWLCKAFDHWIASESRSKVRIFTSIIRMLCGRETEVESLGLLPVDLIVVETDGSIEAVDSLKSTYEGATSLGYRVQDHTFDQVATDLRVRSRQMGADSLAAKCRACSLVSVCGGGYVPHRYSSERGFDNPSVYCSDLQRLIIHIRDQLGSLLPELVEAS